MKKLLTLGLMAGIFMAGPAFGQSLKDKKMQKSANEGLAKAEKSTNEKCGSRIKASIDFASWKVKETESISFGHCDYGLDEIRGICSDADGKAAVAKKIKKYVCKFSAKARAIVLKGDTLTYTADPKILMDSFIKEYLENNL